MDCPSPIVSLPVAPAEAGGVQAELVALAGSGNPEVARLAMCVLALSARIAGVGASAAEAAEAAEVAGEVLRRKAAAKYLKVSIATFDRLVLYQRKIPYTPRGRTKLFRKCDLDAYLRDNAVLARRAA